MKMSDEKSANIFDLFGGFDYAADVSSYLVSNPLLDKATRPSCAVRPKDAAKLQQLIRLAAEHRIGLVPVSSSAPHCRGGILCGAPHVSVDLSAWKNCDMIDRRNRVCRIEPGVTFGELLDALEPFGLTVPMPLAPRSGKSVLAAVMDREPTTWPKSQWDAADPLCSSEFIFGTGEMFRTGAAGGPGSLEKQRAIGGAQKSPMGPSQTDFHRVVQGSQGCMGIVTWITIRAELKPAIEEPRLIGTDEIENLIPFVYDVQRPWLGEHSFILNRAALAMLVSGDEKVSKKSLKSLPPFVCLQNIAGFERMPDERVAYQLQDIEEMAAKRKLNLEISLGAFSARELLSVATRPRGMRDWRHNLKGHCLSVIFITTLDRAPQFIKIFYEATTNSEVDKETVGIYVQPVVQNHACHVEFMIPFDPREPDEVERMGGLERNAVNKLADGGAFFSRPYGAAADIAFKRNPLNIDILRKIKNIFDPATVLNPGKFGL